MNKVVTEFKYTGASGTIYHPIFVNERGGYWSLCRVDDHRVIMPSSYDLNDLAKNLLKLNDEDMIIIKLKYAC